MKNIFPELFRLWQYSNDYHREARYASLYSVLNKIFDLAPPLLIGTAVDVVVKKEASLLAGLGFKSVMAQLYVLAILTFVIWAAESLFEYLFQVYWRGVAQGIQHKLRVEGYKHLQGLELSYFEDKSTGNLISILNDDVNQLERFLDGGINTLLQVMTTVIVIGGIFFSLSPMVAIFSFIPVPLILIGSFYYQRKIAPRYKEVREQAGLLSDLLNTNILGMATIKSYTAENSEVERLKKKSLNYLEANKEAIKLSSSFSPLIRMVVLLGFLFTLVLGGYYTTTGSLEVGSYSVLVFMTQRLLWPLTSLGATFDLYQRAMASTRRIFKLMDTQPQIIEGNDNIIEDIKKINFDNVHFSYDNEKKILKNINLEINKGNTIGLVGPTGSGKSSLVKLLLRFYDISKGEILFNDKQLQGLKFKDIRNLFSYVGQEVFLFNGTVEENIRFGAQDKRIDEIKDAAKKAWIHEFIESLPKGYQTFIGERGQKLSGGQKQRLSLARAILKNSPIFIFDEATSAVDNETEALIQKSLQELTKTKTTVIIAHRLSTVVNADNIIVLDEGEIVETGTHKNLLKNGHLYSKLWQVQTGP